MWLLFIKSALLGLTVFVCLASSRQSEQSNLTLYGAPRHNLDGVLPVLSIEEQYIRSQTDGGVTAFGSTDLQCSAASPCPDGSCCNPQGQCGYRAEHCKESCVANCDAQAPCGVNSKDGFQSCPLNVCCSHFGFCGASEFFCRDSTASGESTPCQKGFGKCGTVSTKAAPACGRGSGTVSRRVAYYEGWNTRRRPCDKVWPADIDTTGLTHLIFSFATIDPATFAVSPMHPDDEKLYVDFLGLKDGSQKWIGIGGWEFSDAGATRYTWSQMASSKANRQGFISSLLDFLEKWKFAGVDIDWEWPGAESRGGNPAIDKQNQVSLMKELREALGARGLSVVLPAQYEYLKNLDPKALEGSVDAFNVLAYDLHGPWDATIPGLGPFAKPHTDLNEIDAALELLWFSEVTPSKVNLGIANYGRGYTLADTNCADVNCTWTGPSKAGDCTELAGVLSQCEIKRIISQKNLKPALIDGASVKQIVFDGQWLGYDDSETLGLKTELANNRCLGGTALWAIDYASCTGGGPVGPGAPQHSSAAPSLSAPGVSVAPPPASSVAPSWSTSAALSASAPPSTPAVSSKPAASSTVSSASAKPPAPLLLSGPASSTPASSALMASSATVSASRSSAASSASPPAQSSQGMSSAPSSTPPAMSEAESSASLAPPSSAPGESSAAISAPSSSAASSVSAPAQSQQTASSTPVPAPSGTSTVESSAVPPTVIPILPPIGSSTPASSKPTSSAPDSSAPASSVAYSPSAPSSQPSPASTTASRVATSAQTSQALTSTPAQTSSLGQVSSGSSTLPVSSTANEPSLAVPSGSSSSVISSSWAVSSLNTPGMVSSWASSSAGTTSSIPTPSEQSSLASSLVHSSQTLSGTVSSAASWSSTTSQSGTTSAASSQVGPQSSGTTSNSASSSAASSGAITTGGSSAQFWSAISNTTSSSLWPSLSNQTLTWTSSMTTGTGETSGSSVWTTPTETSGRMSSGTQGGSNTITRSSDPRTTVTTDASGTQTQTRTQTDEGGNTIVVIINPTRTGAGGKPTETGKPDDDTDPDDDDEPSDDDEPTTTPGPTTTPATTGGSSKTSSGGGKTTGGTNPTKTAGGTASGSPIPTKKPGGQEEDGCNPNDCIAECIPWYALSLALRKEAWCPCVPKTCDKENETDSDSDEEDCSLFGCGCGWMGLNFGPGCDVDFKFPLFPAGLFGPRPCMLFGSCPPDVGPPYTDPCGPFGCNGHCNGPGCDPCPPEICGGPQCPISTGCGPKPGPAPTPNPPRPSKCEKEQGTTITEKLVVCTEGIKLEPTTIASLNFTLSTTLTSTCLTPVLYTRTGCGMLGWTTTTTISSLMTTSSEAPMCTRAPLDLNNDEGDNSQPPRTTDGPTCSRTPLSLDDDEGDNEHPEGPSCTRTPLSLYDGEGDNSQSTSSEAPACTRAPLSLDDDEGNNEMPADLSSNISFNGTMPWNSSMPMTSTSANFSSSSSRVLPPSTLSVTTTPSWGTGIPSGTPKAHCSACDEYFANCVKEQCKQDGSDAEKCAKSCLSALCFDSESADFCKKDPCRPAACPKESPHVIATGEPAIPFTTTLSLPSTTLTVTATPPYSEPTLSHSPTPTCTEGQKISPHGKWTVLFEHKIREQPDNAALKWDLWDEHGCHAGNGMASNNILGHNITTQIGAMGRPQEDKMGYTLHTNVTESLSTSSSEIYFQISKPVAGCQQMCHTEWKINTRDESNSWEIVNDCAQSCGMRKLEPTDVSCDNGINKWQDNGDDPTDIRGGYCTFRMPFDPADDSAPAPPAPWSRNSRWTVDIIQQMKYETASIEWWLKDPNGKNVTYFWKDLSEGGTVTTFIESDPETKPESRMRYKMLLTVSDPRNKDKTRIQIQYMNDKNPHCKYCQSACEVTGMLEACQPNYRTETNDETEQSLLNTCWTSLLHICPEPMIADNRAFSCDPVPDAFYPVGAGFERRFRCWWPNDFDAPFGLSDPPPSGASAMDLSGMSGTAGALGIGGGPNGSWTNATWR